MNERPTVNRLREALLRVDLEEIDQAAAEEIGPAAVAVAIAEPEPPAVERYKPNEELADAALQDAIEVVNRRRMLLGRRVCSRSDATITRQISELLRRMVDATGGADNDPSFQ